MSTTTLTWLRPEWLWCLLPLALLAALWFRRANGRSAWDAFVDKELQPYVIEDAKQKRNAGPSLLFFGWVLSVLMLAGPVWNQQQVPVFKALQSEVILFDLSQSMLADDIPPDRLTRARFKLLDRLARSQGRQLGLIAFSERPYVISPLTEDAATIEAFVPSLAPDIMPVQGSRLDLAIDRAVELLDQAAIRQGHIIVITDAEITEADRTAARAARDEGHRLSVLAVGTSRGAPLRDSQGQFLQRANGSIVVPRLDMAGLESLASTGGGVAVMLSTDDSDLDAIDKVRAAITASSDTDESSAQRQYWIEYSPWLLWLLLPLLLMAFRRGVIS